MDKTHALLLIGLLTLLAAGLAWRLGAYGAILAGCAGLLAVFPLRKTKPGTQLLRQRFSIAPPDEPDDSPEPGPRARFWKRVVAGYAAALILFGFAVDVLPYYQQT